MLSTFFLLNFSIAIMSTQIGAFMLRNIRLKPTAVIITFRPSRLCVTSTTTSSSSSSTGINTATAQIERLKVKKILDSDETIVGRKVLVQGWVRTLRDQKNFSFIEINDGSTLTGIQTVRVFMTDL